MDSWNFAKWNLVFIANSCHCNTKTSTFGEFHQYFRNNLTHYRARLVKFCSEKTYGKNWVLYLFKPTLQFARTKVNFAKINVVFATYFFSILGYLQKFWTTTASISYCSKKVFKSTKVFEKSRLNFEISTLYYGVWRSNFMKCQKKIFGSMANVLVNFANFNSLCAYFWKFARNFNGVWTDERKKFSRADTSWNRAWAR